ncbi:hypothetical protein [Burkholderia aenigmatica]|nr:hypothetical protein [Burkholderia aenigmatica]MDN7874653.1 hypothetical protein [Burkholderia aenigmatica]
MRQRRPTDPAACFARQRAALARDPAPPLAIRPPHRARRCAPPCPA